MQKKQAKQAKNLQAAERQHKKDKADLRDTIRLTPDAKLTGAQKRRLSASIQKAKRDGKIPQTAQQTIPYREMCRDGICVVTERFFTKQVQYFDINYQLAQNEDKNLIFEKDGLPLEKVLGYFIRSQFLVPKVRPYRTENLYAALERLDHQKKEVKVIAKKAGKTGKKTASGKKTAQKR